MLLLLPQVAFKFLVLSTSPLLVLRPCVSPLKPPPHLSHSLSRKETHLSTTYSLNESSTAPRRSIERETLPSQKDRGSSRSVRASTPVTLGDEALTSPLMGTDNTRATLESSATLPTSTLQSGKSVRNYKRAPSGGKPGLSESQPHVYPEEGGSYFSWLHLIGRSSKRYTVTEPRKQRKPNANNNTVYRQNTRYRHIPGMFLSNISSPTTLNNLNALRLSELGSNPNKDLKESLDSKQLQREASNKQTKQVKK